MPEFLTFSNKDSLIHARFWNSQLASKLYHEVYSKPYDSSKFFLKGTKTPICIIFHQDVVVKVQDFNKELIPKEPVQINVHTAFPALNYHRKSFLSLPKAYFEQQQDALSSELFLQGLAKRVDEDLEDHIRYFVERCDILGGFQIFSDYNNYYEKAFSLNLLDHFTDEYPKSHVINFSSKTKSVQETDYYKMTADLYFIGKSVEYNNYTCVPMGWGFTGEWTAQDYAFESVCALGASIFNLSSRQSHGINPFSIAFYPEYLKDSNLLLDLFDCSASSQKPIAGGDELVYGLRNKDGYIPHKYSYAFEPKNKLHSYLKELFKEEKPHFFSKNDLERDVMEEIHMLLDK